MMKRIFALLICTNPAWAECSSPDVTFLSCAIQDSARHLEVCVEGAAVIYRFGPPGAPELELTTTAAEIDYRPWPGIGRTIYEEVTFENAGYRYEVYAGVHRDYAGDDEEVIATQFGGVGVYEGEAEDPVASFVCTEGRVEFLWTMALSDAKNAAGLSWDHYEHDWLPTPEN